MSEAEGEGVLARLKKDYESGFVKHCRLKPVSSGRGYFESRLLVADYHSQQDNYVHAGVMATMSDQTAGFAAFTLLDENHRVLTIEFKINFLRPASGGELICRSRVIKDWGSIMMAESEVYSEHVNKKETLVAKALVTLAVVRKSKLKAGGTS